jgi:hypothetical protein
VNHTHHSAGQIRRCTRGAYPTPVHINCNTALLTATLAVGGTSSVQVTCNLSIWINLAKHHHIRMFTIMYMRNSMHKCATHQLQLTLQWHCSIQLPQQACVPAAAAQPPAVQSCCCCCCRCCRYALLRSRCCLWLASCYAKPFVQHGLVQVSRHQLSI